MEVWRSNWCIFISLSPLVTLRVHLSSCFVGEWPTLHLRVASSLVPSLPPQKWSKQNISQSTGETHPVILKVNKQITMPSTRKTRLSKGSFLCKYMCVYIYIYAYLEPKWPLVWLEQDLFSKIEVSGALDILYIYVYIYIYIIISYLFGAASPSLHNNHTLKTDSHWTTFDAPNRLTSLMNLFLKHHLA